MVLTAHDTTNRPTQHATSQRPPASQSASHILRGTLNQVNNVNPIILHPSCATPSTPTTTSASCHTEVLSALAGKVFTLFPVPTLNIALALNFPREAVILGKDGRSQTTSQPSQPGETTTYTRDKEKGRGVGPTPTEKKVMSTAIHICTPADRKGLCLTTHTRSDPAANRPVTCPNQPIHNIPVGRKPDPNSKRGRRSSDRVL